MRISDWSSDVCSSDLPARRYPGQEVASRARIGAARMRVADGDGEKLQEPQPRAVVGRRDQRRQGKRRRGKGGELSHYPSLRQRAGAARGSTRRRATSACPCSWGVPTIGRASGKGEEGT